MGCRPAKLQADRSPAESVLPSTFVGFRITAASPLHQRTSGDSKRCLDGSSSSILGTHWPSVNAIRSRFSFIPSRVCRQPSRGLSIRSSVTPSGPSFAASSEGFGPSIEAFAASGDRFEANLSRFSPPARSSTPFWPNFSPIRFLLDKKGVPEPQKGVPLREKGLPESKKGVPFSEKGLPEWK